MIKDSGNRTVFESGAVRDIQEKWKPIKGYEGIYEVSNMGNIRSTYRKKKLMKPKLDNHGYYRVDLCKDKKPKTYLVSRLVAIAFIDNPQGKPHVGHDDDNPKNNRVDNLYWTDPAENNRHNGKLERLHKAHNEKIKIISQKLAKPVIRRDRNGNEKRYNSVQEARKDGFEVGKISMCCNGKRKTHKGNEWRFENDIR